MCTAATYYSKDHYFGRNLDLEYSYHETVTVVPRNFELKFRHADTLKKHHALIGMAYVVDDYPLFSSLHSNSFHGFSVSAPLSLTRKSS